MVSVIIPTLNCAGLLGRLLEGIRRQTVDTETIVVDSSSDDGTAQVAAGSGARTVSVAREDFDHGAARNLGLANARGEIVIYLTQDVSPIDERAFRNLIAPLDDGSVAAAYGRQLPYPDATPFAAHLRLYNYPAESGVKSFADRDKYRVRAAFLSHSFAAYRKKTLEEIGGFREHVISSEDVHAGARLLMRGYRIAYAASAEVFHSHNYTVKEEFQRYFDHGVFHGEERWLADEFGRPEPEGLRYLASELRFLRQQGELGRFPECLVRNAAKYAGFFLGRSHRLLPGRLAVSLSRNKGWWRTATARVAAH